METNKETDQLTDDFSSLDIELGTIEDSSEEGMSEEDKQILENEEESTQGSQEEPAQGSQEEPSEETTPTSDEESTEEKSTQEENAEGTDDEEKSSTEGEEAEDGEADNPLQLHAAIMKERGLLPSSFDENEVEGETLDEQIKSLADTIEKGYEDRYNSLKESVDSLSKEVLDKVKAGFTEEEAKESVINREKINQITDEQLEEDSQLQENLYREYLEKQGVKDQIKEKMIQRSRDADTLYEDSKEARDNLPEVFKEEDKKKEEEIAQQQEEKKKKREETQKQLDEKLNSLEGKEIFPGVKITKNEIPKIKDILLKPAEYEEKDGKQVPLSKEAQLKKQDPIDYYIRLAALANAGAFDKNADAKKAKQRVESDTVNKLSKTIAEQQKKEKSKKSGVTKESEKEDDNEVTLPDFGELGLK